MSQSHSFDKSYLEDGTGFKSWFFTHDHKRLGVMYLWAIGIFFILAAIASFLIKFEHLTPGQTIVDAQTYNVLYIARCGYGFPFLLFLVLLQVLVIF